MLDANSPALIVYATASKTELARDLVELVAQRFYAARGADTEPRLTVININD